MDSRPPVSTSIPTPDPDHAVGTGTMETRAPWNISAVSAHRLMDLPPIPTSVAMVPRYPYPTVDVPDHAHYTIGCVILVVGITGMVGNFLVIYAFCRSKSLRTPANMFIINLAVTDLLMCITQTPVFFITSMHKRWIFGEKACELYAFCGALFGMCSMITLMVIAVDRYIVITRPLASIGVMSHKRALLILAAAWMYSMVWSLPPFFGWSAYVPEGLMTSCSWDYVTFTPSVRAYTMLLFIFIFFIPLFIIIGCYCGIFRAIRETTQAVSKINGEGCRESVKRFHKMKSEWKMAKIALIVILLYIISWAPYSCVALTAFAGHADLLTPYIHSVPAVIAKASAIHNPIIYAISHPKYRAAIGRYIPCLAVLLCVPARDQFTSSSFQSTRRSTLSSQSSETSRPAKPRLSSLSDSESGVTDTEAELTSRLASRQVSIDVTQNRTSSSQRSKVKGRDSGVLERGTAQGPSDPSIGRLQPVSVTILTEPEDISMSELDDVRRGRRQTPPVITTTTTSPFLLLHRRGSRGNPTSRPANSSCLGAGSVVGEPLEAGRLETALLCDISAGGAYEP